MEIDIAANVARVRENIALAAVESGRRPEDIVLVAATKMNDAAAIRAAIDAGVDVCGENRVQELRDKLSLNAYGDCPVHMIGHLQRNKVRQVVGKISLIQSIDSAELMRCVSDTAESLGIVQDVLIEVNIAGEASKSGFAPSELAPAIELAAGLRGIRVRGLMAVPPICENPVNNRPCFDLLRQLFIDNDHKIYDNVQMEFMSVGMSGDYVEAIRAGSNMVRVGSAIFGPRNYGDRQR